MILLRDKKGQEEIVGFVLIFLIVAIVGVIFLGISLRSEGNKGDFNSEEVYQFLDSLMRHTSDCAVTYEPIYVSMGELISSCNDGKICTSGQASCDVLESELSQILNASWDIGVNRPNKGYIFNVSYKTNSSSENILGFSKGNCSGSFSGADYIIPGGLVSSLNLCS
jgi:hypothetical protein